MSRRDEILEGLKRVEALPTVLQQALRLMGDPDADASALGRIIELDPGLTANILRLANSSYFGGLKATTSVREAVLRLGFGQVFQFLLAAGMAPRLRKPVAGYDLPAGALLEASAATALASTLLADRLGIKAPDHTFTAGLLADIGKLALGTFLAVDAAPILQKAMQEGLSFEAAEETVLGINHAEAGAELLAQWNLPPAIVNVVRWRYDPDSSPMPDLALDLVHAGSHLARSTGLGNGIDGLHYAPKAAVSERLGLDTAVMDATLLDLMENLHEVRDILHG